MSETTQAGAKAPARRYGEAPQTAGCFVIGGGRQKIRTALISEGFERGLCSRDAGDGKYSERWTDGTNVVLLKWGKRKP